MFLTIPTTVPFAILAVDLIEPPIIALLSEACFFLFKASIFFSVSSLSLVLVCLSVLFAAAFADLFAAVSAFLSSAACVLSLLAKSFFIPVTVLFVTLALADLSL
jgi:hypothetical protein